MAKCCEEDNRTILLYSCSGGANVGEAADKACRQAMYDGCGTMFCVVGLGGDVQDMIQTARDADVNIVVDGCDKDCAKNTFDRCGLTGYVHIRVTDLGIEKAKPKAATDDEIAKVLNEIKNAVATA